MLRRAKNLRLIEEKPRKLARARTVLLFITTLFVVLFLAGVAIFSCVHGTKI